MTCVEPGCTRPVRVKSRGLCASCYNRALRNGLPSLGEPLALTGGRWVRDGLIQRWQPDPPFTLDRPERRRLNAVYAERFGGPSLAWDEAS